jgi:hypothetical protein
MISICNLLFTTKAIVLTVVCSISSSAYKKQRLKAEKKGNLENEARISNYIGDIYEKYGR